ncbi:hypothetical protein PIB30_024035 [Stylosanthes scabra]|uniref:Uncharacterized protein n=1 Tax=Stylosanthes scabra TaxID=79078 RepID=A0ABU6R9T7_9FABA|nr:hypothetical protein [Stylosanthes scabra]
MDSLLSLSLTPKLTSFNCTPILIPLSPSITAINKLKQVASLHTRKWFSTFQACTSDADKSMQEWDGCYLQNRGGLGVALLSVTANTKLQNEFYYELCSIEVRKKE